MSYTMQPLHGGSTAGPEVAAEHTLHNPAQIGWNADHVRSLTFSPLLRLRNPDDAQAEACFSGVEPNLNPTNSGKPSHLKLWELADPLPPVDGGPRRSG